MPEQGWVIESCDAAPADDRPDAEPLRCTCGRLLVRLLHRAVELKCPRCKRGIRLHWRGDAGPGASDPEKA